jgi:hypothetical protein
MTIYLYTNILTKPYDSNRSSIILRIFPAFREAYTLAKARLILSQESRAVEIFSLLIDNFRKKTRNLAKKRQFKNLNIASIPHISSVILQNTSSLFIKIKEILSQLPQRSVGLRKRTEDSVKNHSYFKHRNREKSKT